MIGGAREVQKQNSSESTESLYMDYIFDSNMWDVILRCLEEFWYVGIHGWLSRDDPVNPYTSTLIGGVKEVEKQNLIELGKNLFTDLPYEWELSYLIRRDLEKL